VTQSPLPQLTEQGTLEALRRLGMEPCEEHAPDDPEERVSGYLGAIMALAQAQITSRGEHRDTIMTTYHETRAKFHPAGPCMCGCGRV
jgi:hypothetical protein